VTLTLAPAFLLPLLPSGLYRGMAIEIFTTVRPTIAEFSPAMNIPGFFAVSLVDGYNLPLSVTNNVGCSTADCPVDLGPSCTHSCGAGCCLGLFEKLFQVPPLSKVLSSLRVFQSDARVPVRQILMETQSAFLAVSASLAFLIHHLVQLLQLLHRKFRQRSYLPSLRRDILLILQCASCYVQNFLVNDS
jgi:hypothetical protein